MDKGDSKHLRALRVTPRDYIYNGPLEDRSRRKATLVDHQKELESLSYQYTVSCGNEDELLVFMRLMISRVPIISVTNRQLRSERSKSHGSIKPTHCRLDWKLPGQNSLQKGLDSKN